MPVNIGRIYPKPDDPITEPAPGDPSSSGSAWVGTPPDPPESEAVTDPTAGESVLIMPGGGIAQIVFFPTGPLSVEFRDLVITGSKYAPDNCRVEPDILYNGSEFDTNPPQDGTSFVFRNTVVKDIRVAVDGIDRFLMKDTIAVLSACPDINWQVIANVLRVQHCMIKYGALFGFVGDKVDVFRTTAWHMEFYSILADTFNDFQMHKSDMCLENLAWLDPRNQLQAYAKTGAVGDVALPNVYILNNGNQEAAQDYFQGTDEPFPIPGWTFTNVQNCYLAGERNDEFPDDKIEVNVSNSPRYMYCQTGIFGSPEISHDGLADVWYEGLWWIKATIPVIAETDCIHLRVGRYPTVFGTGLNDVNVEYSPVACNVSHRGGVSPEDGRACTHCDNGFNFQCVNNVTFYDLNWFQSDDATPCCFEGPYGDGDQFDMASIWTYRYQIFHNGKVSRTFDFVPMFHVIVNGPTNDIFRTLHIDEREAYLAEIQRDQVADTFLRRPDTDPCYLSACTCGGSGGMPCGTIVPGSAQVFDSNHWCSDNP